MSSKAALNDLQKALEKAVAAVQAEREKLEQTAQAATGGKILPITQLALPGRFKGTVENFARSMATNTFVKPHWTAVADAAEAELASALASIEEQHAANLPAIQNNEQVRQNVTRILEQIGIPATVRTYRYPTPRSRTPKEVWVNAGYVEDLREHCKTGDGYVEVIRQAKLFNEAIANYRQMNKTAEAAEARKAEAAQKAQVAERTVTALAAKYGLLDDDPTASVAASDVWDAILDKNKYLRLAHYLQANREDWSDGCDLASTGLNGFFMETEEDHKIYDCIASRLENWEGDGRVFRDCEYGYDYLFNLAAEQDPGLMKDYLRLQEVTSR